MELHAFDLNELIEKMEGENIDNLSEVENTAQKTETNWVTKYILVNTTGESVFTQEVGFIDDEIKTSNIKELELQTTPDGRLYFQDGAICDREYVENFIRTNYMKGWK